MPTPFMIVDCLMDNKHVLEESETLLMEAISTFVSEYATDPSRAPRRRFLAALRRIVTAEELDAAIEASVTRARDIARTKECRIDPTAGGHTVILERVHLVLETGVYDGAVDAFGNRSGYGTFHLPSGPLNYEGKWKEDRRSGSGTEYRKDTQEVAYEGDYLEDERHGKGKHYNSIKQLVYTGEWERGLRHGQGTSYRSDGSKEFEGAWAYNLWHGSGRHYEKDETDYVRQATFWESSRVAPSPVAVHLAFDGMYKRGQRDGEGTCFFSDGVTVSYRGGWAEGKKHGHGTEFFRCGNPKYEGEWSHNKKHGDGKEYNVDGCPVYSGHWLHDRRHGIGTAFHPGSHAMFYIGQWRSNVPHGRGKAHNEEERLVYDGAFVRGKRHGDGKAYRPEDGSLLYDGSWSFNLRDGRGTSYHPGDGAAAEYEGAWSKDMRSGVGLLYHSNGNVEYEGAWVDGLRHGTDGTEYSADSVCVYKGDWERGLYHGFGKCYSPEGTLESEGTWKDGRMNGKGTLYHPDGRVVKYRGDWVEGARSGHGSSFYATNGALQYKGLWHNGKRHGYGTAYDRHRNLLYEGEWHNDEETGLCVQDQHGSLPCVFGRDSTAMDVGATRKRVRELLQADYALRKVQALAVQCAICFDDCPEETYAYIPCGHRCLCGACHRHLLSRAAPGDEEESHTMQRCLICRSDATACVRIF